MFDDFGGFGGGYDFGGFNPSFDTSGFDYNSFGSFYPNYGNYSGVGINDLIAGANLRPSDLGGAVNQRPTIFETMNPMQQGSPYGLGVPGFGGADMGQQIYGPQGQMNPQPANFGVGNFQTGGQPGGGNFVEAGLKALPEVIKLFQSFQGSGGKTGRPISNPQSMTSMEMPGPPRMPQQAGPRRPAGTGGGEEATALQDLAAGQDPQFFASMMGMPLDDYLQAIRKGQA